MRIIFKCVIAIWLMSSISVFAHQKYWSCYAQSPTWWGISEDWKTGESASLFAIAVCASGTPVGARCLILNCSHYYKPEPIHEIEVKHENVIHKTNFHVHK